MRNHKGKIRIMIFVFVTYYLIFHTPHVIINYIISKLLFQRYITKTYQVVNSNDSNITRPDRRYFVRYTFDHFMYDGALMVQHIRTNPIPPPIEHSDLLPPPYANFQIIRTFDISAKSPHKYSSFTYASAKLMHDIVNNGNKTHVKVCVIVSKRKYLKNKWAPGNFLTYASYTVRKTMSVQEICRLHHDAVANEKQNPNLYIKLSALLFDRFDVILNSHRELSHIKHTDGSDMYVVPIEKSFENVNHMQSLLYADSKKFIILSYMDKQWIVDHCFILFRKA